MQMLLKNQLCIEPRLTVQHLGATRVNEKVVYALRKARREGRRGGAAGGRGGGAPGRVRYIRRLLLEGQAVRRGAHHGFGQRLAGLRDDIFAQVDAVDALGVGPVVDGTARWAVFSLLVHCTAMHYCHHVSNRNS